MGRFVQIVIGPAGDLDIIKFVLIYILYNYIYSIIYSHNIFF